MGVRFLAMAGGSPLRRAGDDGFAGRAVAFGRAVQPIAIVGLAVLAFFGFVLESPGRRIAALSTRVTTIEAQAREQEAILDGLARFACFNSTAEQRELLGLGCAELLNRRRVVP